MKLVKMSIIEQNVYLRENDFLITMNWILLHGETSGNVSNGTIMFWEKVSNIIIYSSLHILSYKPNNLMKMSWVWLQIVLLSKCIQAYHIYHFLFEIAFIVVTKFTLLVFLFHYNIWGIWPFIKGNHKFAIYFYILLQYVKFEIFICYDQEDEILHRWIQIWRKRLNFFFQHY